jgi:prepilin-type processing-associated H-X9-DG protein
MCLHRRRFSCPAITPIELLVSLGAMSLLAGVLAAGANGGSQSDRRNRCLGNLRTIMQTAFSYAENDPDGILGPVLWEGQFFIFEGYMEYGGGPGTMNFTGWGEEFDPRTRPFNQMLYGFEPGEMGVANTAPGDTGFYREFQCAGLDQGWQDWPGWGSDPRETETPYFKANGTAFRMNNLPYFDGTSHGIYGRSLERIPAPAQTIGFMEARVFQTLFFNDVWDDSEFGELSSYHEKRGYFNVSYADGHASFADFGDGTYYEHIPTFGEYDARGTWGRMDCLPDPPFIDGKLTRGAGLRLGPQASALRRAGS